jgi:imidazolonepropionase-like amidohydrolase
MWMAYAEDRYGATSDGPGPHPREASHVDAERRLMTFEEKTKGSIEPGKLADMVVISKDYLHCPVDEIKDIEALLTVVGGQVV